MRLRNPLLRSLATLAFAAGLLTAFPAQAINQLYTGQWSADSFGNDIATPNATALNSQHFAVYGIPQGVQCNPYNPLCKIASTPIGSKATTTMSTTINGGFPTTGNGLPVVNTNIPCYPVSNYGTARPAKGKTLTTMGAFESTGNGRRGLPLYRNPAFFTTSGAPNLYSCTAYTRTTFITTTNGGTVTGSPGYETIFTYAAPFDSTYRGTVALGKPVSGMGVVNATAFAPGAAFTIAQAGVNPAGPGMHRTTQGEFNNIFPYIYSYTYATFRNDVGSFAGDGGPGNFNVPYKVLGVTVASVNVNAGPNKFGGVMKLLGKLTTKVCYYRSGGCSLGRMDWRYDAIGAAAYTSGGVVTAGYTATYDAQYYHTLLMTTSTIMAIGSRFPWTTGTATVTAVGRGPNKTIEERKGFDNRTGGGSGTLQLVSPILTRWLQPAAQFETGGIGILRFTFAPEPRVWMALVSGLSVLAVLYRARRH
ncbi:MAG: hypothetical protein HRU02_10470 [Myxococcales bacterium]|nr:hypothetical protein [Myxococcales bacterium]